MILVARMNGRITELLAVDAATWDSRAPKDMLGIPIWWFQDSGGALYVWPKPIPECDIYRLEKQGFVVD